jgi:integrase
MVKKKFTATKKIKGHTYQYFRKNGRYVRLPDDPNSEEYDRAYWKLMRGIENTSKKSSFENLIKLYKQTPRYIDLSAKSKKEYNRYFDYLIERAGSKDAKSFQRKHALEIQSAFADKPRSANYLLQTLSILFEHSIDLGWRKDNPAKGVRKLKGGSGHIPWPNWAIERFRKHAPENTKLLFELALGTGQRASDLIKMKWTDIEADGIYIVQNKTGAKLWVPCTDSLSKVLRNTARKGIYILTNKRGAPLTYSGIAQRLTKTSKQLGTEAYTLHGLRYSAASHLAELGATDAQIAAITGHKARSMIVKYSSGANQRRLANQIKILRNGK